MTDAEIARVEVQTRDEVTLRLIRTVKHERVISDGLEHRLNEEKSRAVELAKRAAMLELRVELMRKERGK